MAGHLQAIARIVGNLAVVGKQTQVGIILLKQMRGFKSHRTRRNILQFCRVALNRRGHLSCEWARRILFRQADLTEERLETWNGAERVGHGIHV
jgi:hypothetical protein